MNRRDILNGVLDLIEEIIQSGEEIPDELLEEITSFIQEENELINQQPPIEPPPEIPEGAIGGGQPSNDAQLLWVLAGQQPQAFISYLRTYPTAQTQALLQNQQQLNDTIVQLQQEHPKNEPASMWVREFLGAIPKADLQSSNVWGANYDPRSGKMRVRFQGGSVYEYDGIPQEIFDAFIHGNANARTKGQNQYGMWWPQKNPSLGAALNQYIKAGGFPYRRIR